jgi:hypothetical protein
MRESRTYGSARGALSNGRPYRDERDAGNSRGVANRRDLPRMSLRSCGLRVADYPLYPRTRASICSTCAIGVSGWMPWPRLKINRPCA